VDSGLLAIHLEEMMGKNDVAVDEYDKHVVTLTKGCFLLCPVETYVIKEMWVLFPKETGCEIYLRQRRFDWLYWTDSGVRLQPAKLKALTEKPKSYAFKGTLEEALASLRKFGIEEHHLEILKTPLPR
jgi:hypothetical protein